MSYETDGCAQPAFVSLHDVAHAHALAATSFSHTTNGKRYLLIGHRSSFDEVARIVGEKRPELKTLIREEKGGAAQEGYGWESGRVERDLGFKCTSRDDSVRLDRYALVPWVLSSSHAARTDQPLEDYVGDFADQMYELMHAAGQV